MSVLVSIIVPIYNEEKYIEKCLVSLFEQSYDNIEYIFVNDCSQDGSMIVLDKVLLQYPNRKGKVIVINNKRNMGIAAVRNIGLINSSGSYIIFCDSDDFADEDMVASMLNAAVKFDAQIVISDYYINYKNMESIVSLGNQGLSNKDCIKALLSGTMHGGLWNKLINKKLFYQGNRFVDGINMWEDLLMSIKLFNAASCIHYLHKPFYHYVQFNQSSATYSFNDTYCNDVLLMLNECVQYLRSKGIYLEYENYFMSLVVCAKAYWMEHLSKNCLERYMNLFPESNYYIWSCPAVSLIHKLCIFCYAKGCKCIAILLITIVKIMKRVRFSFR